MLSGIWVALPTTSTSCGEISSTYATLILLVAHVSASQPCSYNYNDFLCVQQYSSVEKLQVGQVDNSAQLIDNFILWQGLKYTDGRIWYWGGARECHGFVIVPCHLGTGSVYLLIRSDVFFLDFVMNWEDECYTVDSMSHGICVGYLVISIHVYEYMTCGCLWFHRRTFVSILLAASFVRLRMWFLAFSCFFSVQIHPFSSYKRKENICVCVMMKYSNLLYFKKNRSVILYADELVEKHGSKVIHAC
jgi:hypothetical protein